MQNCVQIYNLEEFKISEVKLYTQGAQIIREKSITLKDMNDQNILLRLQKCSICAQDAVNVSSASTDFTIESKVTTFMEEPEIIDQNVQILVPLLDSLESKKKTITELRDIIPQLSKFDKDPSGQNFKKATLVCDLLEQASKALSELKLQKKNLIEEIKFVDPPKKKKKKENAILVTLKAKNTPTASIDLKVSYFIENAGWIPEYTYSFSSSKKQVMISCHAAIQQQSGEHWNSLITIMNASFRNSFAKEFYVINSDLFNKIFINSTKKCTVVSTGSVTTSVKFIVLCSSNNEKSASLYGLVENCPFLENGKARIVLDERFLHEYCLQFRFSTHAILIENVPGLKIQKTISDDDFSKKVKELEPFMYCCTFNYWGYMSYVDYVHFESHVPSKKVLVDVIQPWEHEENKLNPNSWHHVTNELEKKIPQLYREHSTISCTKAKGVPHSFEAKWLVTPKK